MNYEHKIKTHNLIYLAKIIRKNLKFIFGHLFIPFKKIIYFTKNSK
jgi:hypothetical protein